MASPETRRPHGLGWEKGQVPGFMGEITIADGFIIYIYMGNIKLIFDITIFVGIQ